MAAATNSRRSHQKMPTQCCLYSSPGICLCTAPARLFVDSITNSRARGQSIKEFCERDNKHAADVTASWLGSTHHTPCLTHPTSEPHNSPTTQPQFNPLPCHSLSFHVARIYFDTCGTNDLLSSGLTLSSGIHFLVCFYYS